jgi:hypothetical protein
MKNLFSLVILFVSILSSSTALAGPGKEYEDFLDKSAEEMRLQIQNNETLIKENRAGDGVYFKDLTKEYYDIDLMATDKSTQFSEKVAAYNNKLIVVLMPLYPESEKGKTESIADMEKYATRYCNKYDPSGNMVTLFYCVVVEKDAQQMYTFPVLRAGSHADQAVAQEIQTKLSGITCKQLACYVEPTFIERIEATQNGEFTYFTYEQLLPKLSNGRLFFVSPTGKLFSINITALHDKYKNDEPLYAFNFFSCEGADYSYGLTNIKVKLHNQNWNIKTYHKSADNIFTTTDLSTPDNIKAEYPRLSPATNVIVYSSLANNVIYFGHVGDIPNYNAIYTGSIAGTDCAGIVMITPPGTSGGTSSTATLNPRARTVKCTLTQSEIHTINSFLENNSTLNIIVTPAGDKSSQVTSINPGENTIWIAREEDESLPDGFQYRFNNEPKQYTDSWANIRALWQISASNLGEADKPDFDNFFSDMERSGGYLLYSLSQWHVAAEELNYRLESIRIPEKVWNYEHPDYSPWLKNIVEAFHKNRYTEFKASQQGSVVGSFVSLSEMTVNVQWAAFCGLVNGVIDIVQTAPQTLTLIHTISNTSMSEIILKIETSYDYTSNYKSPNGQGTLVCLRDGVSSWLSKQNATTYAHHLTRLALNIAVIFFT